MPGSGRPQVHGLAAALLVLTASFANVGSFESSNARFPSARPVADGNHASLNPGGACRLLQPNNNARAHPASVSILTREWSSRSATRRHQPMPVALARRCVAASRTGESRPALGGLHRRDPLTWTRQITNQDRSRKVRRALFGRSRAYPSRGVPGIRVADSNDDEVWRTASHFASTKVSLERHPAKADAVEKTEMPSTVREPLRERGMTPPRAPGPQLRHAAS